MSGFDLSLFRVINTDLSNAVFDFLMPVITNPDLLIVPLGLVGIGLVVWGGWKGRLLVVMALLLLLITSGVSGLLKLWFQRPRPCQALEAVRVLVGCKHSFSFPSSHATNVTAQALLFAFFYRPVAVPLFVMAAAVGYSRVYVGVHYPIDVVGGVLVGLVCGAGAIRLTREVERRLPWPVHRPKSEVENPKPQV